MREKFHVGTRLQERDGHRLKAVLCRDVVFAPELPRGNARTGQPPLTGKRVRGYVREAGWYHGSFAFRPCLTGMRGIFYTHIPKDSLTKTLNYGLLAGRPPDWMAKNFSSRQGAEMQEYFVYFKSLQRSIGGKGSAYDEAELPDRRPQPKGGSAEYERETGTIAG